MRFLIVDTTPSEALAVNIQLCFSSDLSTVVCKLYSPFVGESKVLENDSTKLRLERSIERFSPKQSRRGMRYMVPNRVFSLINVAHFINLTSRC